ncbi:isoprenylcysteine carboxylmethyltransferase family protein [Streptococcus sp. H31]|uniref:methyltransferase family protein n=1 Tax=Streptococcus huangxiaojuni TaxID=3237239 RepID=UPI0034A42242
MPALVLLLPFLLIRFGLLSFLSKSALAHAAHFAPMANGAKAAYYIYQSANLAILGTTFFVKIKLDFSWLTFAGSIFYGLGLILCAIAVSDFAGASSTTFCTRGLYSLSRHPMYLAYFVCFLGMAGLTKSVLFLACVLVFQVSAHWIILAEERECLAAFGEAYRAYCKKVRRYL